MSRIALAVFLAASVSACDSGPASSQVGSALVEEQLAHHVGVIAYLYGYPAVDMYRRMHNETHRVSPEQSYYSPINTLAQLDGRSWAGWLDLREGALLLRARGEAGQQFSISLIDFMGRQQDANLEIPAAGVAELLLHSDRGDEGSVTGLNTRTPFAYLVIESAHAPAEGAVALHSRQVRPAQADVRIVPLDPMLSLGYFEILNLLLKELPMEPGAEKLVAQFDSIGVGPGSSFELSTLAPARKRGLERAIRDARLLLETANDSDLGGVLGRAVDYRLAFTGSGLVSGKPTGADSR
jgi:hypothetical protein